MRTHNVIPRSLWRGTHKNMLNSGLRTAGVTITLFCAVLLGSVRISRAEVLTWFADKAIFAGPPNSLGGFSDSACPGTGFNGQAPEGTPPEGFSSWKTTNTISNCPSTFLGVALNFGVVQNLSRFEPNGELRFWINAAKGDIKIEIHDINFNSNTGLPVVFSKLLTDAPFNWRPATDANQWRYYHIPFQGNLQLTHLASLTAPFVFTALSAPTTFYIDNVRYADTTTSPIFDVTVHNINNDQLVPAGAPIDWNGTALPAGWTRANQYIRLDVDMPVSPWGVQIYTDNVNGIGASKFTGDPTKIDPSGLVNTSNQARSLATAWSIKSTPFAPATADPNDNGQGGRPNVPDAFQWSYLKDVQTKDIPGVGINPGSTAFFNGDPFIAVKNNLGNHFVQGNALDSSDFGAENTPNYIYFEANFNGATTPNTYTTTQLIVELYTL